MLSIGHKFSMLTLYFLYIYIELLSFGQISFFFFFYSKVQQSVYCFLHSRAKNGLSLEGRRQEFSLSLVISFYDLRVSYFSSFSKCFCHNERTKINDIEDIYLG